MKNKFRYFTVFIFLAILFLINTDTVFAGRVGGGNFGESSVTTTTYKPVEALQSSNGCKIYTSSNQVHTEQRQFSLGWKADIFANHEDFYSGNASSSNVAWTTFNDLIAYPYIILFEEKWKDFSSGKTYYKRSTGYLYMYVDSYQAKEMAAIWASYANTDEDTYIPLYYQNSNAGSEGNGEAFFGFRGMMTYLPISNIKCVTAGANYGAYYAQNFNTESQTDAVAVLEKIMTQGDSKQNVSGWEPWSNDTPFLMGNLLTNEVKPISSKYKWVSMFAIGGMGENTHSGVGVSYVKAGKTYKVKKEHLLDGFNGLAAELGTTTTSLLFKSMITGNPNITTDGYYGFKDNYQIEGIDNTYFGFLTQRTIAGVTAPKGVSHLYKEYDGSRKLLDGQQILERAYNILFSDGSYNILDKDRIRLTPSSYESVYNEILSGVSEFGESNFIYIPGVGHFRSRYSWGATVGSIAACQDVWYSRDAEPDKIENHSSIIAKKLPGYSIAQKKTMSMTKNFGTYATDNWNKLSEDEKITNTLIMLESFPWDVPLIASKNANIRKVIGTGADSVKRLNALGANKKTYSQWRKVICELGDYITQHSLTSVFPANGWSAQSVFSGGGYYSNETYPIFIALTPKTTSYEDLLISNSYGTASDTSVEGDSSNTHIATSRKTIDWGSGIQIP